MTTYGTFGELLQGYNLNERKVRHFLFTLPVKELYSRTKINKMLGEPRIHIHPTFKTKSLLAFKFLCEKFNIKQNYNIHITIDSNIPIEKGYASSTADIVSVCQQFFHEYPKTASGYSKQQHILEILSKIEYSDYLLHEGISACYQREHQLIKAYSTNLQLFILGVDEKYQINTDEFHSKNKESSIKFKEYNKLFRFLDTGLSGNDFKLVGDIATESAVLHQDVLPKKNFPIISKIKKETNAIGICVAHSGSLIGLMFSRRQFDFNKSVNAAKNLLAENKLVYQEYNVLE